jgi:hypothetical protein
VTNPVVAQYDEPQAKNHAGNPCSLVGERAA